MGITVRKNKTKNWWCNCQEGIKQYIFPFALLVRSFHLNIYSRMSTMRTLVMRYQVYKLDRHSNEQSANVVENPV